MSIWKKLYNLKQAQDLCQNTLMEQLGIMITDIGDDYLKGTMPVDQRTHQPMGFLHGGASAAFAETLGSIAGNIAVPDGYFCVGIEINANHLKGKKTGTVMGTARPLSLGSSIQVWQISIEDEKKQLVCTSRLTLAVRKAG